MIHTWLFHGVHLQGWWAVSLWSDPSRRQRGPACTSAGSGPSCPRCRWAQPGRPGTLRAAVAPAGQRVIRITAGTGEQGKTLGARRERRRQKAEGQGERGGAKAGEKAGVAAGQSQPGPRVAGSLHPGFEGGTEGPQLCLRRWEGARGWEAGLWGPPRSAPDLHGAPPQMTYCVRSPALQLVERSEPSD